MCCPYLLTELEGAGGMASSRAPGSAHLSFTMAGVCGGGGVAGYVKARSVPSLVAGLACGGLSGLGAMVVTYPLHVVRRRMQVA